jgi:hypothetical protein
LAVAVRRDRLWGAELAVTPTLARGEPALEVTVPVMVPVEAAVKSVLGLL